MRISAQNRNNKNELVRAVSHRSIAVKNHVKLLEVKRTIHKKKQLELNNPVPSVVKEVQLLQLKISSH